MAELRLVGGVLGFGLPSHAVTHYHLPDGSRMLLVFPVLPARSTRSGLHRTIPPWAVLGHDRRRRLRGLLDDRLGLVLVSPPINPLSCNAMLNWTGFHSQRQLTPRR